jgi:hypothetical protein
MHLIPSSTVLCFWGGAWEYNAPADNPKPQSPCGLYIHKIERIFTIVERMAAVSKLISNGSGPIRYIPHHVVSSHLPSVHWSSEVLSWNGGCPFAKGQSNPSSNQAQPTDRRYWSQSLEPLRIENEQILHRALSQPL